MTHDVVTWKWTLEGTDKIKPGQNIATKSGI